MSAVQAPRQSLFEHPMSHIVISRGAQAPRPSQPAALIFMPPAQDCIRQFVAGGGKMQFLRVWPLHCPAQVPVPAHRVRVPRGCWPGGMGAQTPSSVATSQASH